MGNGCDQDSRSLWMNFMISGFFIVNSVENDEIQQIQSNQSQYQWRLIANQSTSTLKH